MTSNSIDIGALFKQITSSEIQLVKPQLLAFAATLQTPGANYETLRNSVANFALEIPQLNGPAQGVAFNILGAFLTTLINSIPTA